MRLTDGLGVDFVVNTSGFESIPQDIAALRKRNGVISLVGLLAGIEASWSPRELLNLMYKRGHTVCADMHPSHRTIADILFV